MSSRTAAAPGQRTGFKGLVTGVAALALVGVMAWDTKVVTIGSDEDVQADVFSAESFGAEEFPRVRSVIEDKAAEAPALAEAIEADKDAAVEQYGTPSGIAPVMSVSFTGTVGEGKSGIFDVAVDGMPDDTRIRVQTGPAINGTDLRDAPGDIAFGQFTNQIEYQNAGAALNNEMKVEVLEGLDREALTGKTVTVTGVFRLINPANWLVTPVRFEVQ